MNKDNHRNDPVESPQLKIAGQSANKVRMGTKRTTFSFRKITNIYFALNFLILIEVPIGIKTQHVLIMLIEKSSKAKKSS